MELAERLHSMSHLAVQHSLPDNAEPATEAAVSLGSVAEHSAVQPDADENVFRDAVHDAEEGDARPCEMTRPANDPSKFRILGLPETFWDPKRLGET